MSDMKVKKGEVEKVSVKEMYVYYWYCSPCDTDNCVSSMERLTYFKCETCGKVVVQSYTSSK